MAAPNTNWVYENGVVTERDRAAAIRAERLDRANLLNLDGGKLSL